MIVTRIVFLFLVACSAILFSGCGKELKLAIRAEEAEKDKPSATLVRRVEVSYHDPSGQEKLREHVAVIGLSQPVSMRADLLKELNLEQNGVFEARGYAEDGLLLLRGVTHVDPERDEAVEVVMTRSQSQETVLDSPLLRKVRLVDAPISGDFVRESRALRAGLENGSCLELPKIKVDASSGRHPKIVFEASVKTPSFKVEVGVRAGGVFKALTDAFALEINPAGNAELELGRRFLAGALFRAAGHFVLRLHSSHYEGCLELDTTPELKPVSAAFQLDRGVGKAPYPRSLEALGILALDNPNEFPMMVRVEGWARHSDTGEALRACYSQSNDPSDIERLHCAATFSETVELAPRQKLGRAVFLGINSRGVMLTREMRVNWRVTSWSAINEQEMTTVEVPAFIP